MPWTAILTTGAKALAGGGAKAALKAGATQAVKGAGRKMAGKMLGRGKKGQGPQQQPQSPSGGGGGGEDVGGSLVPAGSSAIIPTGVKSSALAISQTSAAGGGGGQDLEGTVLRIKTSVIKVENLLAGSAVLQERQREDARKAKEAADAAAAEGKLEKPKDKKQKFSIPQPKVVKSFWQKIMSFITNTLLGFITVRLLPFMDKMAPVIKLLVGIGEWALKISGWIFNVLVTAVDLAYEMVGKVRKWVGNTFGEEAVVWFDKLTGVLKDLINGFIVWKFVGEKIFQAAMGAIKNAWKFAANIVKQTGRLLNWASGGRLGNIARRIGVGAKRLIGPGARKFLRAPGKALGNIGSKVLQGGKGLLAKGAGKVGGLAAKIFGKAAGPISGAFKAAKPFLSKFFGRIPIIGPLIVGIVSLLSGEPATQAIFKAVGAALGGALGSFIPIPILGTLLGETIGVFVGDLLYTLMFGGGIEAAGKKLKDTLMGILKAGKAVVDWVGGGIKRFTTNFLKETAIDIPKGGLRWSAMTGIAKVLGLYDWLKSIGYTTDDQVSKFPNLLQLMNPFKYGPILIKSFFPPGESKEKEEKGPSLTPGNPQTKDDDINAVSTSASYEEDTVVLPPRLVKEGDGDKTSAKALFITSGVLYASGSGSDDPYEKLYVGGLG